MKTVLAALLAVALVACGREEPGRVPAGDPADKSEKSVGKKTNPPEGAPTGADPMKEGY